MIIAAFSVSAFADESVLFKCEAREVSEMKALTLDVSKEVAVATAKIENNDGSVTSGSMRYMLYKKEYVFTSVNSNDSFSAIHLKKYGKAWGAVVLSDSPVIFDCDKK